MRIRGSGPEAALLRFVTELGYLAIKLPEFDVMTIDETLSVFFCCYVVGANKLDRPEEMTVLANDICPVLCHLRVAPSNMGLTEIVICLFGPRLETPVLLPVL